MLYIKVAAPEKDKEEKCTIGWHYKHTIAR